MLSIVNFYDFRSYSITDYIGGGMAVSMAIFTLGFIGIVTILLKFKGTKRLPEEAYEKKFSSISSDLSKKGVIGNYWQVFILIRWVLVSCSLVFLKNYPEF